MRAEELQVRLSETEAELAALREDRGEVAQTAASLEERLAEALAAKTAAENEAVENADLIADLQRQVTALEADVAAREKRIASLIAANEAANAEALSAEDVRAQLAAALAAKLAAEEEAEARLTESEQRAAMLGQVQAELDRQRALADEAQEEEALLNQQVRALRDQLGQLQALLDDAKAREAATDVQLQSLGNELNTALARVAAEERRRRELEEAERKRLEAERADLEKFRSEFFGRLRQLLEEQEGVRIVGDRFVFSSEVLFAQGEARLSDAGEGELAKVADILRSVAENIPEDIDWVIQVDGHTDDVPVRPGAQFEDNWDLSQARALSVVRYMVNFLGLPPDRLSANGFGQYQPINPADTPEARAQNRRIELKLTEK